MGWRRDLITAAAAIVRGKNVIVIVSHEEDIRIFFNLLRRKLMERNAAHSLVAGNGIYSEFCGLVRVVAVNRRYKADIVIKVQPLPKDFRRSCSRLRAKLDAQYTAGRWPPWHP